MLKIDPFILLAIFAVILLLVIVLLLRRVRESKFVRASDDIRFHKPTHNPDSQIMTTVETKDGWQIVPLEKPIDVKPDDEFAVIVIERDGYYTKRVWPK